MPHHPQIEETYLHLARALAARSLAYVHLKDQGPASAPALSENFLRSFRETYPVRSTRTAPNGFQRMA